MAVTAGQVKSHASLKISVGGWVDSGHSRILTYCRFPTWNLFVFPSPSQFRSRHEWARGPLGPGHRWAQGRTRDQLGKGPAPGPKWAKAQVGPGLTWDLGL